MSEYIIFAVVLTAAVYGVYLCFAPSPRAKMAAPAPPRTEPIVLRDFKEEDLKQYTGADGGPVYLAADGVVFDVSRGRTFYGPGAWYSVFAARDATIGLATAETDPSKWVKKTVAELTAAEVDVLHEWTSKYQMKYDVVGYLNDGANPKTVASMSSSASSSKEQ